MVRKIQIPRLLGIATAALLVIVTACDKTRLSRSEAEKLINEYLSSNRPPIKEVPLHYEVYAADAEAVGPDLIRQQWSFVTQLESAGLIENMRMVSRKGRTGMNGDYVAKFEVSLSEKARPHVMAIYERQADFFGVSNNLVARVALARPKVTSIAGITEPGSGSQVITRTVDFSYRNSSVSPFGEIFLNQEDVSTEGRGSAELMLYDDGWKVKTMILM